LTASFSMSIKICRLNGLLFAEVRGRPGAEKPVRPEGKMRIRPIRSGESWKGSRKGREKQKDVPPDPFGQKFEKCLQARQKNTPSAFPAHAVPDGRNSDPLVPETAMPSFWRISGKGKSLPGSFPRSGTPPSARFRSPNGPQPMIKPTSS